MPDPSAGVFLVVFGRGTIKVGKKTYPLPDDDDEPIVTVEDLLAFIGQQVSHSPEASQLIRSPSTGRL